MNDMEAVEQRIGVTERIMGVFGHWKNYYIAEEGKSPDEAARDALNQTLGAPGIDHAKVQSGELGKEVGMEVARALIKVSEPRMREIIQVMGKNGDPLEQADYTDIRARRIISAARKILGDA